MIATVHVASADPEGVDMSWPEYNPVPNAPKSKLGFKRFDVCRTSISAEQNSSPFGAKSCTAFKLSVRAQNPQGLCDRFRQYLHRYWDSPGNNSPETESSFSIQT
jgi:hypothetical protein